MPKYRVTSVGGRIYTLTTEGPKGKERIVGGAWNKPVKGLPKAQFIGFMLKLLEQLTK